MDWREKAQAEIRGIKATWATKYGWAPEVQEQEGSDGIDLHVRFVAKKSGRQFALRLRYQSDFETAGRREAFVDPENVECEGSQFWPTGVSGFNSTNSPQTICLEGTWGFHSHHHRDRDGRRANLNKLLMEIQKCLNA